MPDLLDQLHEYADALEACVPTVTGDEATAAAGTRRGSARRSRRMWLATAAAAALVVVIVAVGGAVTTGGHLRVGGSTDDLALRDALVGRRFVLASITEDGQPKVLEGPALNGEPAIGVITFRDATMSASAGCNSTSSGFEVVDGRLVLTGDRMSTLAGCAQPQLDQDQWLVGVLASSPTIGLDGERLTLRTDATTIELVERAAAPDPPAPTTTTLDPSLLRGRTFAATSALVGGVERRIIGLADEPEPHRLLLTFGDGTVRVRAGCSEGEGPYTLGYGHIDGLALTSEASCPSALLDQAAWLNGFFAASPSLNLDGDYLTLGNGVDTIIVFVDAAAATPTVAAPPLFGTSWGLDRESAGLPPWFEGQYRASLLLTDGEPQTVYLRDGCNVVTGEVHVDVTSATTGSLSMGDLQRTDATCPASDDPIVEAMSAIQTGSWSYVIGVDRLELSDGARTLVFVS